MKYLAYLSFLANIALGVAILSGNAEIRLKKQLAAVVSKHSAPQATPAPKLSNGDWMRQSGAVLREPAKKVGNH
jgi:hypothetical protein